MPRKPAKASGKAARGAAPAARRFFDPSQLGLTVPPSPAPSEQRVPPVVAGVDLRAEDMHQRGEVPPGMFPRGATVMAYEGITRESPAGVDHWSVVVAPDRTCAFASSAQYFPEEEGGTQRLMHWAVAWSEAPAAHTMWVRQWGRFARVRRGSDELRSSGAVCRRCRTRDPQKCEAIRRAQRALDIALLTRTGRHGRTK